LGLIAVARAAGSIAVAISAGEGHAIHQWTVATGPTRSIRVAHCASRLRYGASITRDKYLRLLGAGS